jgi:hypothetical protein
MFRYTAQVLCLRLLGYLCFGTQPRHYFGTQPKCCVYSYPFGRLVAGQVRPILVYTKSFSAHNHPPVYQKSCHERFI